MAYGRKTSNIMDIPLSLKSVFSPYVGDNGYTFVGLNTIYVLSNENGTLVTYDETSATAPFGAVTLATPTEQELTLAYNQAMIKRIQRTQIQDTPVDAYARKWAVQQIDQVFIPAHDMYSINKLVAARPLANRVDVTPASWADSSEKISFKLHTAVNMVKGNGGDVAQSIAWLGYTLAANLSAQINFTGSDAGYKDAKAGYLGKHQGVTCVEIPDDYFPANVHGVVADKRAIVNVAPKMDPKNNGYTVIDPVPMFSGIEIQLRDRGDTFVLNKKANAIVTLEEVA